jgi:hypothetical protein
MWAFPFAPWNSPVHNKGRSPQAKHSFAEGPRPGSPGALPHHSIAAALESQGIPPCAPAGYEFENYVTRIWRLAYFSCRKYLASTSRTNCETDILRAFAMRMTRSCSSADSQALTVLPYWLPDGRPRRRSGVVRDTARRSVSLRRSVARNSDSMLGPTALVTAPAVSCGTVPSTHAARRARPKTPAGIAAPLAHQWPRTPGS